MKRIFTLLLGSLFSLSLLAADANRLSVSTVNKNMDLTIEVDGRRVAMNDNAITLRNLSEGYHTVKIFAEKKRNGNGNGNAYGRGRKADVIYNSSVFIKRGFHLDITVNRFGKVLVDERRMDRNDDWYADDDYFDDGWDNNYRDVINAHEFEQVKQALSKEWLEANRLKSTKFIIDQNNFTTAQVKDLMMLFTFENNRLEIAKYAYKKTVDKRSYYQLNDALSFSSSRDELARYIRDVRF